MKKSDFKILKQTLRENGFHKNGDLWGTAMSLMFDLVAIDCEISNLPNDWGYHPGIFGNHIEEDNRFLDMELTEQTAHDYGNYLNRLVKYLEYKGLSY